MHSNLTKKEFGAVVQRRKDGESLAFARKLLNPPDKNLLFLDPSGTL